MRRIPLRDRHGKVRRYAFVDDEDYEYLMQWRWHLNTYGYAVRNQYLGGGSKNSKSENIAMHRLLNKTPHGFDTDHYDRNPLHNWKSNLFTVTKSRNGMNRGKNKNNTSGHKGVTWHREGKKWMAQIVLNRKLIYLGLFNSVLDACRARKEAERIYHVL